jgi:hypothetical protein
MKHRLKQNDRVRVHVFHPVQALMICGIGSDVFVPRANAARCRSYSPSDGNSTLALRA